MLAHKRLQRLRYTGPMRLVDTHCHLNDSRAFPDPGSTVDEAMAAGVCALVCVGIDDATSHECVGLAEKLPSVFATVGWHPNHAAAFREDHIDVLTSLLGHPKVVGLGEIGLDYYRDHATREQQAHCLNLQLELAKRAECPVVFHCRDAYADLLGILEAQECPKAVLHCFAGNEDDLDRANRLGLWFGIDGPVTYKSADNLRAMVAKMPRERVLLETDAPWLAPHPFRGQTNSPSMLPLICAAVAECWDVASDECARITSENASRFYRLPPSVLSGPGSSLG